MIQSPARSPAFAAPVAHQFHGNPLCGVDGYRKRETVRRGDRGGVHADHAPGAVEQRPAGVAGIKGGVRLNDIFDHASAEAGQAASERADDPGGYRELEAEWRSHGDRDLTRLQLA
jgi:hypothetical protein